MHITGERRCIACRNHHLKSEMIRISKNMDTINIGDDKKLVGRGVYVCKNAECINLVIKKKMLNRAFSTNINDSVYDKLRGYIE